jgi:hypothetical protein
MRWLVLIAALAVCSNGYADEQSKDTDFQFALLRYNGDWNPRPHGLPRLAWEVRRRTSIAVELATVQVDAEDDTIFNYPFIVWQGTRSFGALSETAVNNLRHHLTSGGTLLIDISDGGENGPFEQSVRRELTRILPDHALQRVSPDHVLYKTFYLVDRHGGRQAVRPYLDGIFLEGRLAVVLSSNDLAGAMSRDEYGEWDYDVGVGGDAVREVSFRLGVNLVMYALCLDYKEDQVHIPFILERRR